MKYLVLTNPTAAGGRTIRQLPHVRELCAQLPHTFDFEIPIDRNETLKHAQDAASNGYDAVIAFGGDGTLVDVVEGVLGKDIPIGLIPCGRGNDFARNTGISLNCEEAVQNLASGTTRTLDVGEMNGFPYLNVGGVGFDAEVAGLLHRTRCKLVGTICYVYSVIRTMLTFKPLELKIEADDEVIEGRFMMVAVANGQRYGGGMRIAPDALMDDGLLDVILVKEITKPTLLRLFPSVYSGKHITKEPVRVLRAKQVTITSPIAAAVAVDGEARGNPPAHFSLSQNRVKLLYNDK